MPQTFLYLRNAIDFWDDAADTNYGNEEAQNPVGDVEVTEMSDVTKLHTNFLF